MKRSHDPDAASTSKQRKECDIEKILSDVCIPEHVWKIIFSLMKDQNKLLKLRSTNKFFDSLITSKIYSEKLWEKLSYQHKIIPWHRQIAASVRLLHFPETDETLANHERWRKIYFGYRKWVQTPNIRRSPELLSLIRTESMIKKFTCVAAWGGFTASAINKGMISVYFNLQYLTELSLPTLSKYLKVEKLEFWKQKNASVIIYGRLESGQVLFWNVWDGEIINSNAPFYENIRCMDHSDLISINNNLSKLIDYYYIEETEEIIGDHYRILGLSQLRTNLEEYKILDFFSNPEYVVVAYKSESKLLIVKIKIIMEQDYKLYQFHDSWTIELDGSFTESLICHIPICDIVLLADGQQLFMLTPERYFDEVRYHVSTLKFQKEITSLKMFCNCIIIGYVDGTIKTIYIDDYQTYEKHGHGADTTEVEYTLDVGNNAVMDIDISTKKNYKLYIVAVTKSTTYQLTFE
ncbi:GSCOCG00005752001-RA-CDS [Cotesia congregata]|uniref:F-box domain-containing protein n=1 Tax=Cotesia congregata TaxID=51543 RepID=A0A8J2HAA2_COTCN|nr:GSCOCG00005752001-RA-CDS [Cotesia congregata]CAG5083691.1 Protein of unknown function [Cotesia congregata]